jgi:methyl-accepting chemotaxis protein
MKLRGKFSLMVGIPLLGMLAVFGTGLWSFDRLETSVQRLAQIQGDANSMVNADRDAYQARSAMSEAQGTLAAEELDQVQSRFEENVLQAKQRVEGPAARFSSEMQPELERFRSEYESWRSASTTVVNTARQTAQDYQEARQSGRDATEAFGAMRGAIDEIGIAIDAALEGAMPFDRRRQLERALSLVLNGDRDAYQAMVFRFQAQSTSDPGRLAELNEQNRENIEQTGDRVRQAAALLGTAAAEEQLGVFNEHFAVWQPNSRQVLELLLARSEETAQMNQAAATAAASFAEMRDTIDQLQIMQEERATAASASMSAAIDTTNRIYFTVVVIALATACVVAFLLVRRMLRALYAGTSAAEAIAAGDLTVSAGIASRDELGQLSQALQRMVERLSEVVGDISTASDNVRSGSRQLAASSEQLSQGATEQAASTEEVSSSMEEMASTIQQNADNSQETERIARKAAADAEQTGGAVRETVDAMRNIAEKISIIEEIARNTNLLALNAAIEAARAGEQGKGFAVVASEVRKLAERSQTAATEISELSSNSVDVAEEAGRQLEALVPDIRRTAELVQEISASSAEQRTGSSQVNKAIAELDQVVQQNASHAEEMSATAETLSGQADQLQESVQFFRLANAGSASAPRAASNGHAETKTPADRNGRGVPGERNGTPAAASERNPAASGQSRAAVAATLPAEANGHHPSDEEFESF